MIKFFIGSHGRIASGFKSALNILVGDTKNVYVVDAYVDEKCIEDELEQFLASVCREDQIILISDLFGGSVNNAFWAKIQNSQVSLIAGANLSLILELVSTSMFKNELSKEDLIGLIEESKKTIKLIENENVQEEEFF